MVPHGRTICHVLASSLREGATRIVDMVPRRVLARHKRRPGCAMIPVASAAAGTRGEPIVGSRARLGVETGSWATRRPRLPHQLPPTFSRGPIGDHMSRYNLLALMAVSRYASMYM